MPAYVYFYVSTLYNKKTISITILIFTTATLPFICLPASSFPAFLPSLFHYIHEWSLVLPEWPFRIYWNKYAFPFFMLNMVNYINLFSNIEPYVYLCSAKKII